jgi:gluconolactonase
MAPPTWLTSIAAPIVLGAAIISVPLTLAAATTGAGADALPAQAQVIDQKSFNALAQVPSQDAFDGSSVSGARRRLGFTCCVFARWRSHPHPALLPPGTDSASLKARPFHVYHDDFYAIIGSNPTLTVVAATDKDPLFHEAVVW